MCVCLSILDINSNEPFYYPFIVTVNKCGGSCNATDDLYARVYDPNLI